MVQAAAACAEAKGALPPRSAARRQINHRRSGMLVDQGFSNAAGATIGRDTPLPAPPTRLSEAVGDLAAGMARSWIWSRLAYQDIKLRYRGSVLGPFWVTLTNLILIVSMGVIYARLFHVDAKTYVPYIMMGILVWQFISGTINEACGTFTDAKDVIQQVPMPFSVQAYRVVYRNLIVFGHNVVIVPFGIVLFKVPVDWHLVEIVPGLFLLSLNGLWISLILGALSTRFRDIPPIVSNVVQVLFFLTPIFWPLDAVGDLKHWLALNPFFAWIDVVRAPLLGVAPEPTSWPILAACVAVGGLSSFVFFVRFRERIAYWI
jgi:ABC-2 type transport system permease protein/lipopolysaccharide transport system permease protein